VAGFEIRTGSEVAPARTFGFLREIEALERMGLASGGRLHNCILIGDIKERIEEFTEFWRSRVNAVNFHAEYYDTLKFRNLFHVPETRNDCHLQPYVLPSGQITSMLST